MGSLSAWICSRRQSQRRQGGRRRAKSGRLWTSLYLERGPHRGRPFCRIEAVRPEEGHGETVHAEGDTGRVGNDAGLVAQSPGRSEVVAVIVEAYAGSRLLRRMQR